MPADRGLARFEALIADFASIYLKPQYDEYKKGGNLTRDTDAAFEKIFRGFCEITSTIDALKHTEALISIAPPRSKRVNKECHINFIVHSYLNEIYILQQRIEAYTTKIARLYKQKKLPELVRTAAYVPLESIIKVRGAHVHELRYTDDDLSRVSTMALLTRVKRDFGDDLEFEYKIAQRSWTKIIKNNNSETMRIVDNFFEILRPHMTHNMHQHDERIIFPELNVE